MSSSEKPKRPKITKNAENLLRSLKKYAANEARRPKDPALSEYRKLLDDEDVSEEKVQEFLEKHSELIPTPFLLNHGVHFDAVLSKFRISTDLTTDFCYLTASSAYSHCVFVELEKPRSRIFKKDSTRWHANFTEGMAQVTEWEAAIQHHRDDIKRRLEPLAKPLSSNPIDFKFVVIVGRSNMIKSAKQKEVWQLLNGKGQTAFWTFDQIASAYEYNSRGLSPKSILRENKGVFTIERFDSRNTPGFFAYTSANEFKLNKADRARLVEEGYNIEAWEKGQSLVINGKQPADETTIAELLRDVREGSRLSKKFSL